MPELLIFIELFENRDLRYRITFSEKIFKMPSGYTQMIVSLDFLIGPSYEIVVVGNPENEDTKKIIKTINSEYTPNSIVILKDPKIKESRIEKIVPFIKDYKQIENKATVYICKNHQCELPTTDIDKIKQFLR